MVQLGDVIEIESSPEPITPLHHSQSHTATPSDSKSRITTKDKGKGKATPYRSHHRLALSSSVIELTDSDSEPDNVIPPSRSQTQIVPGQSSQKPKNTTSIPNLNPQALRAAWSLDNLHTPLQQKGSLASGSGSISSASKQKQTPAIAHQPLFITSDEENGPPTLSGRADVGDVNDNMQVDTIPKDKTPAAIVRESTILIPAPIPQPHLPTHPDHPDQPLQPPTPLTPTLLLGRTPSPDMDPVPIEVIDPTSSSVAQILEIIPNVEPTHLLELIQTHLPTFSVFHQADPDGGGEGVRERQATVEEQVQAVVGHVLHLLFENPDYPKTDLRAGGKGKGKRVAEDDGVGVGAGGSGGDKGKGKATRVAGTPPKKPKVDYASVDRLYPGGSNYFELALFYLQTSFPHIPKPYVRRQLQVHKSLYAPTHLSILASEKALEAGKQKRRPYNIKTSRALLRKPQGVEDVTFEEERVWLQAELAGGVHEEEVDAAVDDDMEVADVVIDDGDDGEDDGAGIECQCCFADYPFSKMVQCPETHLFCSTCISTYAATQLGAHNSSLTCIHSSSCPLPFPASELKRILPAKLYDLYERLEQQKEIMQAGLVGLEECPFCEWKCVLEASSDEDKLFRCGNEEGGCGVVSCRGCKKLDHLPKSCKEVEEDRHLDGRHAIEEAMTRALMRNCPKCQKAFIKDHGCNKMSCPNCHTMSCYVCRQVIKGYDHFNQQPGYPSTSANATKCLLWDAVEERHAHEVKEAAEKAMEEYKRDHPDIDEAAIKVDIPQAPIKPPVPGQPMMYPGGAPMVMYNLPNIIPVLNPYLGHYMQPLPPLPPPRGPQRPAHQPQQRQPPVTRARAALEQQGQKKKTAAVDKVERARMAEQVRDAEEENRVRQRLDRVREQRAVAKREQLGRGRVAMERERERMRQRQPQPQQVQPQVQGQGQLQGQAQPQLAAQGYALQPQPYLHHHHVYHHHNPQQQPEQQLAAQQLPAYQFQAPQNDFAGAYPGLQQPQQQPAMVMGPRPPRAVGNVRPRARQPRW